MNYNFDKSFYDTEEKFYDKPTLFCFYINTKVYYEHYCSVNFTPRELNLLSTLL